MDVHDAFQKIDIENNIRAEKTNNSSILVAATIAIEPNDALKVKEWNRRRRKTAKQIDNTNARERKRLEWVRESKRKITTTNKPHHTTSKMKLQHQCHKHKFSIEILFHLLTHFSIAPSLSLLLSSLSPKRKKGQRQRAKKNTKKKK